MCNKTPLHVRFCDKTPRLDEAEPPAAPRAARPQALSRPQDGWPARALYECFTRDIRLPSPRNKYGGPAFVYKSLRPLRVRDGDRGGRRARPTNASRETARGVRRRDAGAPAYSELVFSIAISIQVAVGIAEKTSMKTIRDNRGSHYIFTGTQSSLYLSLLQKESEF